ncbi:MAG: EAL domain-containing protein [Treponema sp.]
MEFVLANIIYIVSIILSFALAYPLRLPKLGYSIAFLSSALTLILYTVQAAKSNLTIKKQLLFILSFGAAAGIVNFITLISPYKTLSLLSYALFFICINGIVYNLFIFSVKYTDYTIKTPFLTRILFWLFVLDSTAVAVNIFPKYMFDLKAIPLENGITYKIIQKVPYQIHLALSYAAVAGTLICFIAKLLKSPRLYRNKYRAPLLALLLVVVLDALYVFMPNTVDYSIVFFGFAGVCLTWFSLHYTPKRLLSVSMNLIVETMHDGVMFFDDKGECIYRNKAFDRLLKTYDKIGLDLMTPLNSWVNNKIFRERNLRHVFSDHKFDQHFDIGGKIYYFTIWFQNLTEERTNKHLGFFFVVHDRTQEEENINADRFLATHDQLTGLYNSIYFYERVRQTLELDADNEYVMLCSDFDNFKLLNNVLGAETGDNILVQTARIIASYAEGHGVYARLYNDRFALALRKDYYVEEDFYAVIKKIEMISSDFLYPANIYVGAYEISDITVPVSVMCNRAFMAIKTIKGSLHKKIAHYDGGLMAQTVREQKFIKEFKTALANGQFSLYVQPQLSADGALSGAEAVLRWKNPTEGLLTPDDFMPLFERKGLVIELDKFMWESAAKLLSRWESGAHDLCVSVKISPIDFYYADVYELLVSIVEKYGVDKKKLKLEIAESSVILDLERQQNGVERLREFGFDIAVAGFASRYASLKTSETLPFNILKLDMSSYYECGNSERAEIILRSAVNMAQELDLQVIFTGVETEEQAKFIKSTGCQRLQGGYFDAPMTVEAFEKKYFYGANKAPSHTENAQTGDAAHENAAAAFETPSAAAVPQFAAGKTESPPDERAASYAK